MPHYVVPATILNVRPCPPAVIALNPGSLLATNMVKEGYGIEGSDIGIGANVIFDAALGESFADANGRYYDNDSRRFANPHPDAMDARKNDEVVRAIEGILNS